MHNVSTIKNLFCSQKEKKTQRNPLWHGALACLHNIREKQGSGCSYQLQRQWKQAMWVIFTGHAKRTVEVMICIILEKTARSFSTVAIAWVEDTVSLPKRRVHMIVCHHIYFELDPMFPTEKKKV